MTGRNLLILSAVAAAAVSSPAEPLEETSQPQSLAEIRWANGERSPAICLGDDHWLVSVVPPGFEAKKNDEVTLHVASRDFASKVLFVHPSLGLCLIEAPAETPAFTRYPLGRGEPPAPGSLLQCRSGDFSCRTSIAGKDRSYRGATFPVPLLRVRIAEGDHFCPIGTPLISDDGVLEGILVRRDGANQDVAHAVPAAQLHKIVREYESFRRSGNVWVGMIFHNMSTTPEVVEVRKGSPAEEAGIEVGDVILGLNGMDIESLAELSEVIHSLPAGEKSGITVLRGLKTRSLDLVPRFADRAAAAR